MTYIFESGLAHHIEGLIQQKRADGYAYNSEEKLLKRFDTFCVQNYPELTTVTYEMAAKWSEARPGEGDAIIGISFPRYSMRTLKAMEFANDRNAKVITITDSIHSPMNLYSSCNLLARSDMVSIVDSLVAPLSVINALVVALCLKQPEAVKQNLETLEQVWNNYQVYLNDEINFIDDEPMLNYPLMKQEDN